MPTVLSPFPTQMIKCSVIVGKPPAAVLVTVAVSLFLVVHGFYRLEPQLGVQLELLSSWHNQELTTSSLCWTGRNWVRDSLTQCVSCSAPGILTGAFSAVRGRITEDRGRLGSSVSRGDWRSRKASRQRGVFPLTPRWRASGFGRFHSLLFFTSTRSQPRTRLPLSCWGLTLRGGGWWIGTHP